METIDEDRLMWDAAYCAELAAAQGPPPTLTVDERSAMAEMYDYRRRVRRRDSLARLHDRERDAVRAFTHHYSPRSRPRAGRPRAQAARSSSRSGDSGSDDDPPAAPLVPRDLLRAYKAAREECDDAFNAGDLVRVAELRNELAQLSDLVRGHLARRKGLAA